MEAGPIIRTVRRRGQWSLRSLGAAAHTSHATLSAYESGRVTPTVDTLDRVVRSAGFDVHPRLTRRVTAVGGLDRGSELAAVLLVAAQFPVRAGARIGPQRFGQ
jgi:transcriptional regulator with XRE-family HTH domain